MCRARTVQFIMKHFRKPEGVERYHNKLLHNIFIYQGRLRWMDYRWEVTTINYYIRSSYIKEITTKGTAVNYLFYYHSGIYRLICLNVHNWPMATKWFGWVIWVVIYLFSSIWVISLIEDICNSHFVLSSVLSVFYHVLLFALGSLTLNQALI